MNTSEHTSLAITGMEITLDNLVGLDAFQKAVYNGGPFPGLRDGEKGNQSDRLELQHGFNPPLSESETAPGSIQGMPVAWQHMLHVAADLLRKTGCLEKSTGKPVAIILIGISGQEPAASAGKRAEWLEQLGHRLKLEGPRLDLSEDKEPLPTALIRSADWLASSRAGFVIILAGDTAQPGYNPENTNKRRSGSCAIMVQNYQMAQKDANRIYALINLPTVRREGFPGLSTGATGDALEVSADLKQPSLFGNAGYIEVCTHADDWLEEFGKAGTTLGQGGVQRLSIALGCLPSNIGYSTAVSQLASIIKSALCLYYRFIPECQMPAGQPAAPKHTDGVFYLPGNSRPWLMTGEHPMRQAQVLFPAAGNSWLTVQMDEVTQKENRYNASLAEGDQTLVPVAAMDPAAILDELAELQKALTNGAGLEITAREMSRKYLQNPGMEYCVSLLAGNTFDLSREIEHALKGLPKTFESGSEWQTPAGSYFSAQPVGRQGKVAFVYPGGFNSYLGAGKDLLYLFPDLFERIKPLTTDLGFLLQEKLLYPRSFLPLDPANLARLETELIDNPIAMLNSGTTLSVLFTIIISELFNVKPHVCFGYSLGENSMMFASGMWGNGDEVAEKLSASELFRTRLAGPQQAVREYWGGTEKNPASETQPLWENYLLMCPPERVIEAVSGENRVYITHVNTPRQVVIGGDPQGCHRVIEHLKCTHLKAPFKYALHCEAIAAEFEELYAFHDWPIQGTPCAELFSAAGYRALKIERDEIAQALGEMLVQPLDFPRLVHTVYGQGAKIFIELGAGANCSRWISETLRSQPHLAVSINRKGLDDRTSILRLLARLASHRVTVNLEPFFPPGSLAGYD